MDGSDGRSDGALVTAIGRGRHDALAEAYRRHARAVYAVARGVLGERACAEEVAHETFLRLWQEPDRVDTGRASLRSHLLAWAHGRAVDLRRSDPSRRRVEHDAEDGYDLEHAVWDLAAAEHLRGAIVALPEDERRAVVLAYFGGLTARDVAALLGVPQAVVHRRMRDGLTHLRAGLLAAGAPL
jgi:RNA polymerase sigma-70 factor, ECF subfamily